MSFIRKIAFAIGGLFARSTARTPFQSVPSVAAHQTKKGPGRRHVEGDKGDYLPRGYPGAKLARKAIQGRVAVSHP